MELPKNLIIGGMEYKIMEVEQISKSELLNGEIDFFEGVIKIDSAMTEDRKRIALIHEVLHGICDSLGLFDISKDESAI